MTIETSDLTGRSLAPAPGGGLVDAAPVWPPRAEFIERSHQRSAALGLSRGEKCDFDPMLRSDLNVARERNRSLYVHAAPVMHMLFEQIVNTESMIVLTDAQGTILHSVGDDDFLQRADKVALAPGGNWAEYSKGTNAIGTALIEEVPTLVHANEHFMHANNFLTCSAAPIFDPSGNILGVLDVTGDRRSYHQHTMALVRMSARMIENQWLSAECNNRLRLHFHGGAEFIGTLLEGIVFLEPDGRIMGANRSALSQLGMGAATIRSHSVMSLFGTTPSAICDHFRAPLAAPMRLSLPNGHRVHALAYSDWPTRPSLAARRAPDATALAPRAGRAVAPARRAARARTVDAHPLPGLEYLCTGDAQIDAIVDKVRRTVDRGIALLIHGETGTGKDLLARAVHFDSSRAARPFVAVNCAAIPEASIGAELFGRAGGATPGAARKTVAGRIAQADGGTLFLGEVGDLSLKMQARLLRMLQERSVTPLRGSDSTPVDIALIVSTRRNLRDMVARQEFREDLYYRLAGMVLRLPALRERSDIEAVAMRILHTQRPHDTPALSPAVLELFRGHAWPGNVRQLVNVLRVAALMSAGERQITSAHLSDDFIEEASAASMTARAVSAVGSGKSGQGAGADIRAAARTFSEAVPTESSHTLEQAEIALIRAALDAAQGNVSAASKQLGISRNTIYRKLHWNARDRSA